MHSARGYHLPDLSLAWELPASARIYPSQNPCFSGSEMALGLGSTVTFYRLAEGRAPVRARSFLVPARIDRCALSPDSQRMAIYDNHHQKLTLYDCSGSRFLVPLPRLPLLTAAGGFAFAAFDPSSQRLAYLEGDHQTLVVVDRHGAPVARLQAPERVSYLYAGHRSVLFTASGEGLFLGSYPGIEQIDWRQGTATQLVSKSHWVGGLAASPDGRLLAVTDNNGLVLYGLADGEELTCLAESPLMPFSLEFLPDSTGLVVGTQDTGELVLLELLERSGTVRPREEGPSWQLAAEFAWHSRSLTWERFDSDAADPGFRTSTVKPELGLASTGGGRWALADGWNDVRVVGPGGELLECVAVPAEGDRLRYEAVALSPSGRRLAVARRYSLFLWDLESGQHYLHRSSSSYYKDRTHALRFAGEDRLWWASTKGLQSVEFGDDGRRGGAGVSLEGACLEASYALLVTGRGLVCQDLAKPAQTRWKQPLGPQPVSLATSPGRVAVLGRDGKARLLEVSDGSLLGQRQLLSVPRSLAGLGFLGDRWLLVQWEDRTQLWDLEADRVFYPQVPGRLVACLEEIAVTLYEDQVRLLRLKSD